MHTIPLPDDKHSLKIVLDFMLQLYGKCRVKANRQIIRHRYRAAAEKYNKLVGRDLYCLNINLQLKPF